VNVVYTVQLALVGAVALTAGFRLRALRRRWPGDPGTRAVLLGLVFVDCALVLGYPPFYWYVYRLLGHVPALPQLAQHAATMATAYQAQLFTLFVVGGRPAGAPHHGRRRWFAAALAALAICYVLGPLRQGIPLIPARGDPDAGVVAYVAVVQIYGGIAFLDILRICWGNRDTGRRYLRAGLRLIALGCAFGLLYSIHKVGYFVADAAGATPPWAENGRTGVQLVFIGPAVLGICAGITVPFLGTRITTWSDHHHLGRLAATLSRAVPVEPTLSRPRDRYLRVMNRVITIRDCLVGPLRPYLDARVYDRAFALATGGEARGDEATGDEAAAVAEAACIGAALRRMGSGTAAPGRPPVLRYGEDLDAEAAWLARVARAYARSAVVRSVLAELDATGAGSRPA
jgi:hypothetical protein